MPTRRPQLARTRVTPAHARPRPGRPTGSRAAQLCSVLVLGTTTAVLAWSGSGTDPVPDAGAPVVSSVAAGGDAPEPTTGAGTGTVARQEHGEVTGARRTSTSERADATEVQDPGLLAAPEPAAAATPAADATPDATPPGVASPGTATSGAGGSGTTSGLVEPGIATGTDGTATRSVTPRPPDPDDPGSIAPGSLAGRSLAEVLGPAGTTAPAPAPAPLRPPAPAGLDLTLRSTDDPTSTWVVVNKARPLVPADHAPADLVTVRDFEVRAEVQQPLTDLLAAAAADGVQLGLRSAYRSAAYQQEVHGSWSRLVGAARADEVSARAGHSEHQTGLTVDIGSTTRPECDFEDCFDTTAEGAWVAEHAAEFGFIVRYTAATQEVTGFAPEGWHLRFVGTDVVAELDRRGVATLEELFGLPGGPDYS